jgi:hypothetical protein
MKISYATARLYLGITNVGFWVTLSAASLYYQLPAKYLSGVSPDGLSQGLVLMTFLAGFIGLQAPFDLIGGHLLPRAYHRPSLPLRAFISRWFPAVITQALWLGLSTGAIAGALHYGGTFLAWLVFAGVALGLAKYQALFASMIGGVKYATLAAGGTRGESLDESFTGGIAGLGDQVTIIVPGPEKLRYERRQFLAASGQRQRGLRLSWWFNGLGFAFALYLTSATGLEVGRLLECSLIFTLWSFGGLLALPSLTRPAAYAADASLREGGTSREAFAEFLAQDPAQSGETQRGTVIETIFHPLPSAENRLRQWDQGWPSTKGGAWMAARYALFLSWPGLSLVHRAVHCNVGYPDLWVFPPAD